MHEQPGADKDARIRKNAFLSTASNYLGQIITFVVGFALTPFILHRLGQMDYGLWLLVGSLVAYGGLLDLGITGAVTKYVAEFQARGETEKSRSVITTALWLYSLLGLLVMVIAVLFAPSFPTLFNVAPEERTKAIWLVWLMGLGLGLTIPSGITYAVLRGLQRFDYINIVTAGGTLLTALSTVIVLIMGGGLLEMVAVNIPVNLLMQLPALWFIHRAAPGLRVSWRGGSRHWVRNVFSYSSSTMAIQAASQLRNKTDELVIGAFLPVSAVTPYGLARRLSEAAQLLTHQFVRILLPLASQLDAEQDRSRLRALYLTSTRLTLAIFLPIGLGLIALASRLLSAWVGEEYAQYAYLVYILTAAGLVFISQGPGSMILQGIARHKRLAVVSILSGVINLGLSIILVQRIGLIGVAYGTLIPNLLEAAFILPFIMRVLEVPIGRLVRDVLLAAAVPAIPMWLVLYALQALLNPRSLLAILLVAGAGAAVYLAGYWVFGAGKLERQSVLDLLDGFKRFFRQDKTEGAEANLSASEPE